MTSLVKIKWQNSLDRTEQGEVTLRLPVQIGRGSYNDLVLPSLSAGVSRLHARIEASPRGLKVVDLNSANGTWTNGQEIHRAIMNEAYPLIIGTYLLTVSRQIVCRKESCQKVIDHSAAMCPWCGQFTTDALTRDLEQVAVISRQ